MNRAASVEWRRVLARTACRKRVKSLLEVYVVCGCACMSNAEDE